MTNPVYYIILIIRSAVNAAADVPILVNLTSKSDSKSVNILGMIHSLDLCIRSTESGHAFPLNRIIIWYTDFIRVPKINVTISSYPPRKLEVQAKQPFLSSCYLTITYF